MYITPLTSCVNDSQKSFKAKLVKPSSGNLFDLIKRNKKISSVLDWVDFHADYKLEKGLDIFLTEVPKGENPGILANAKILFSDNRKPSYFFFDENAKRSDIFNKFCSVIGLKMN